MNQSEAVLRLKPLQLAWLQELGVEAALLRRHAVPVASSAPAAASEVCVERAARATFAAPATSTPSAASAVSSPAIRPLAPQDRLNPLSAARAAVVRHPAAAPPRVQALAPEPQAVPQRAVSLACQLYAPQESAAGSGQAPAWMVVGEVLAAAGAAQLLHAMLASVHLQPVDSAARLQAHAGLPQANDAARPTLQAQIQNHLQTWQPACILALGRVAASALLQTKDELESLRGKVWSCVDAAGKPVPVVVTYPPGWLLANPRHKAGVWRDLLLARAALSTPLRDA